MNDIQPVKPKKAVIPAPKRAELPAEAIIQQAIAQNVPVETMERLLAMRRELRAEAAKEAFDSAMAKFQTECPIIERTKEATNKYDKKMYAYAPLEDIVKQVKELLGANGLSYSIQTEMTPTHVKVTCVAKHLLGHSESTDVNMPLATRTDIMSAPQQVAATLTFGKRYAFCNAFGIMTGDQDTDGAGTKKEIDIDSLEAKIRGAKTIDQLKNIWASLPPEAKAELSGVKDGVKAAIESTELRKKPVVPVTAKVMEEYPLTPTK